MHKPLFILAPPRSFTSIVCGMIGNHPEMCGLPETNLFAADTVTGLLRIHRAQRRFRSGLLRAIAELGLGEQSEDNIDSAADWLDEASDCTTAELFADLADWAAPRQLVDKSPMHVYAADAVVRMKNAFPEARFLHLLREPRGTCESIYRSSSALQAGRGRRGPARSSSGTTDPDKMWLKAHLHVIDALQDVPLERQLTLRGEDLLQAPEAHMVHIAKWLGIDAGSAAIDAMLHPERSPFACMGPSNAPLGNDIEFLKNPALRPYTAKPVDLSSALSWDEALHFSADVRELAEIFGYKQTGDVG
ncbi:MAG: sulfotransferase [Pseudomonadota bacterium]